MLAVPEEVKSPGYHRVEKLTPIFNHEQEHTYKYLKSQVVMHVFDPSTWETETSPEFQVSLVWRASSKTGSKVTEKP